jgi:hypothetical protein
MSARREPQLHYDASLIERIGKQLAEVWRERGSPCEPLRDDPNEWVTYELPARSV